MNTENHETGYIQPEENKIVHEEKTLEITGEITGHLNEAGKWGKFLAILGFVFIGFMVALGFFMSIILAVIPTQGSFKTPFPLFLVGFIYVIMAAVYFLPVLYLYRFASGIKQALSLKNQGHFANAFSNLKSHYRFIGILMIVLLAFYALFLGVMIVAGVFAGFSQFWGMHA